MWVPAFSVIYFYWTANSNTKPVANLLSISRKIITWGNEPEEFSHDLLINLQICRTNSHQVSSFLAIYFACIQSVAIYTLKFVDVWSWVSLVCLCLGLTADKFAFSVMKLAFWNQNLLWIIIASTSLCLRIILLLTCTQTISLPLLSLPTRLICLDWVLL